MVAISKNEYNDALFPRWKKIKKLLPALNEKGTNKFFISPSEAREILNLLGPEWEKKGNNFFIFFHRGNNNIISFVIFTEREIMMALFSRATQRENNDHYFPLHVLIQRGIMGYYYLGEKK